MIRTTALAATVLALAAAACDGADDETSTTSSSTTSSGAGGGGGGGVGGSGGDAFDPVDTLQTYLTGKFDSEAQSLSDPTYYAVQLWTCAVNAPTIGERVLYVEQALLDSLAQPYRQRLYVVEPGVNPATDAVSRVFELAAPNGFVGWCQSPLAAEITADQAFEREGCRVEMTWLGDHFEGATPGKACLSDLQGATYATSEVEAYADRIESWDRGWDATDQQVWGATAGPYIFDRKE